MIVGDRVRRGVYLAGAGGALIDTAAATLKSDFVWGIVTANPIMGMGWRCSTAVTRTLPPPALPSTSPAAARRGADCKGPRPYKTCCGWRYGTGQRQPYPEK